jgi:hypothetical protein
MKSKAALGFAALALPLLVAGNAAADQIWQSEQTWPREQTWQSYAPRCQPTELARDAALRDPCEMSVAIFGVAGPTVLSRADGLDVQSTGSITRNEPRSPL